MILANYFNDTGLPAWKHVQQFVLGYPHSTTYDTPNKRVEHWKMLQKYLRDNSNYRFDCSYVFGLGLPGSAFECRNCLGGQKEQDAPEIDTKSSTDPGEIEPVSGNVFPYQVMDGCAGAFVDVYSRYLEAPREFLYMGYLTAMGALFSRTLTLASALETQPRLFTIIVGESATERKSTVLSKVDDHFRSVVYGYGSCWGLGSAEGLQRALKKGDEDLEGRPGLVLIFDELKQFVNKCGIKKTV